MLTFVKLKQESIGQNTEGTDIELLKARKERGIGVSPSQLTTVSIRKLLTSTAGPGTALLAAAANCIESCKSGMV